MLGLATGITNTSYQWQPNMVGADLKLWLRNGVGITLNGLDVEKWDDSSGNSNHVKQTTSGDRGLASGGGIEFEFDNGDHYDLVDDAGDATNIAIASDEAFMAFVVMNLESQTNQGLFGQSSGIFIDVDNANKIQFKTGGTGSANTTPQTTGDPFATGSKFVLGIKRDGGTTGNLHMYKNGALLTPKASVGQLANRGSITIDTLGTRHNDQFFDGIIYEVLIYDTTDLTASEITKISNYLNNKHSI